MADQQSLLGQLISGVQLPPAALRAVIAHHPDLLEHATYQPSAHNALLLEGVRLSADSQKTAAETVTSTAAAETLLRLVTSKRAQRELLRRFRFTPAAIAAIPARMVDEDLAAGLLERYETGPETTVRLARQAGGRSGNYQVLNRVLAYQPGHPSWLDDSSVVDALARCSTVDANAIIAYALRPAAARIAVIEGDINAALAATDPTWFEDAQPDGFEHHAAVLVAHPAVPMRWREELCELNDHAASICPPDCWPEMNLSGPIARNDALHLTMRSETMSYTGQWLALACNEHLDRDVRQRSVAHLHNRRLTSNIASWQLACSGTSSLAAVGVEPQPLEVTGTRLDATVMKHEPDLFDEAAMRISDVPAARVADLHLYRHQLARPAVGWLARQFGDSSERWATLFNLLPNSSERTFDELDQLVRIAS